MSDKIDLTWFCSGCYGCINPCGREQGYPKSIMEKRERMSEKAFNKLYTKYEQRAKKKDMVFELTKEHFRKLTSSNCYWCGSLPLTVASKTKISSYNIYRYTDLQLIDKEKGYINNNTRPCCNTCANMCKGLTEVEFLTKVWRITVNKEMS